MKKIALYDRYKSDNEEILKLHQKMLEDIKEEIDNAGNMLVGEFYDKCSEHVQLDERTEYSRLYDLCNDGEVDEVHVITISRLSRDLRLVAQMCRGMHDMGIKVNFIKEKITGEELLNSRLVKYLDEAIEQGMGM